MHWPWSRAPKGDSEAAQAVERAKAALEETRQQRSEVRLVSQSLFDHRQRNHFGENLMALIQGRHG